MNKLYKVKDSRDLWNIVGSFGEVWEDVKEDGDKLSAKNDSVEVCSEIKDVGDGVFVRRGYVKNISDEPVILNTLSSKFILNGGECEVYSQYNGWKNESTGGWQKLVTAVVSRTTSVRSTNTATPFMALWNNQTSRGVAFHLVAGCAWEMRIARIYRGGQAAAVEVELGVLKDGFMVTLAPGEEIELPEIIFYQTYNKTDLDCWRLHLYLNREYPRKNMPVVYNTWLYKFDKFTFEDIELQIEKAKYLGMEYFMIDAGWFGEGPDWWGCRGDWKENQTFGFHGRMREAADLVRKNGMKFGFWLEPECASFGTKIVEEHPEYFVKGDGSMFINFANPAAVDYIFNKTCELIDAYDAEYLKFDFNCDMKLDIFHNAFIDYFKGNEEFLQRLRERYPNLYILDCASGGTRMCIRDGKLYDSFWMSDNQSPYFGIEMYKNSILRMAPQWIDCWATFITAKNIVYKYDDFEYVDRILACNDGTWNDVSGVHESFLKGFMTGKSIGLSCDLAAFSDELTESLKEFIAEFKKDREFWKTAVCHILTDTDTVQVLEYRSPDFARAELVIFNKKTLQEDLTVYPVLEKGASYEVPGIGVRTAEEIYEKGIEFTIGSCFMGQFMTLIKKIG